MKRAFTQNLIENCSDCHGNATSPLFAIDEKSEAFRNLLDAKKIDFTEAESSRVLQRLKEKHNCGGEESCNKLHENLLPHIEKIAELLFVEEEVTSYTSKARKISELNMKDLFVNNAEDRFIELEDIFQQHASGNAIKIKGNKRRFRNRLPKGHSNS